MSRGKEHLNHKARSFPKVPGGHSSSIGKANLVGGACYVSAVKLSVAYYSHSMCVCVCVCVSSAVQF